MSSSSCALVVMMIMVVVFQGDVAQGINLKRPPRQHVTHPVGGSLGWGWYKKSSLADWVKGETFHVDDKLYFVYNNGKHNVYQVDKRGYDNCKISEWNKLWTSGRDLILLDKTGMYYFICSFPGTCGKGDSGMKLKVNVIN